MAEKIFQQGVKRVGSFRHKMTLMRLLIGCGCGEAELKTCKTYFLSLIKKNWTKRADSKLVDVDSLAKIQLGFQE